NSTTSPLAASYAIPAPTRDDGACAGVRRVQVVPSHVHVSPSTPFPFRPPNSTICPRAPSYANPMPNRVGGAVGPAATADVGGISPMSAAANDTTAADAPIRALVIATASPQL